MSERLLVTGGTGFTGTHLVRALLERGDSVRVLARSAARAGDVLPPAAEAIVGDITDPAAVARAMAGIDLVFHLATTFREAGIPDSRHRAVHVYGTRLVLEAACREGVRRVVHVSTIGVHGDISDPPADETAPHEPGDIYQQTKSEGERLALSFHREHGLPVAIARPASIYGPGDMRLLKLFRMVASRRFVMLGSGQAHFHPVYVEDLVRGLMLLSDRDEAVGEPFIIAGERSLPLRELVDLIARTIGVPAPRMRFPVAPVLAAAHVMKAVCVPLGLDPPLYPRRVAFFTKHREFSIDKARCVLQYEPRVTLEDGIRQTADWYTDQGYL